MKRQSETPLYGAAPSSLGRIKVRQTRLRLPRIGEPLVTFANENEECNQSTANPSNKKGDKGDKNTTFIAGADNLNLTRRLYTNFPSPPKYVKSQSNDISFSHPLLGHSLFMEQKMLSKKRERVAKPKTLLASRERLKLSPITARKTMKSTVKDREMTPFSAAPLPQMQTPFHFIAKLPNALALIESAGLFELPDISKMLSHVLKKQNDLMRAPSKATPSLDGFFYLRPQSANLEAIPPVLFPNPYDLEVAEFADVDPTNFYTISASGIANFSGRGSTLTPLSTWLREYYLFHGVVKIPFFCLYRQWKAFSTWRQIVRHTLFANARRSLQKSAFVLSPITANSLLRVMSHCYDVRNDVCLFAENATFQNEEGLGGTEVVAFETSKTTSQKTWTFDEFRQLQANNIERMVVKLHEFANCIRGEIQDCCTNSLENALSMLHAVANTWRQAAICESAEVQPDMFYTKRAAMQAERRRLQRFVKLVDYIRMGTLNSLVVNSARRLLLLLVSRCKDLSLQDPLSLVPESNRGDAPLAEYSTVLLAMSDASPFTPIPRHSYSRSAFVAAGEIIKSLPKTQANYAPLLTLNLYLASSSSNNSRNQFSQALLPSISITPPLIDILNFCEDLLGRYNEIVDSLPPLINSFECIVTDQIFKGCDYSESPKVAFLLSENHYYRAIVDRLQGILTTNFAQASQFAATFIEFQDMVHANQKLKFSASDFTGQTCHTTLNTPTFGFVGPLNKQKNIDLTSSLPKDVTLAADEAFTTTFLEHAMELFAHQIKVVGEIPDVIEIDNFSIDATGLKRTILPLPRRCFSEIANFIPKLAQEQNERLLTELDSSYRVLSSPPHSVESFVENLLKLESVKENINSYELRAMQVTKSYELIQKYDLPVSPTDIAMFQTLAPNLRQLKDCVEINEELREENVSRFSVDLDREISELVVRVGELRSLAQDPLLKNPNAPVVEALEYLAQLNKKVAELQRIAKVYSSHQQLFRVPVSSMPELDELQIDVDLKTQMWQTYKEWESVTTEWDTCPFEKLQPDAMLSKIATYLKVVYNVEKSVAANDVTPKLRELIEGRRNQFQVLVDLRNPHIKSRHWERFQELVGKPLVRDDNLTLSVLAAANVFRFKDEIAEIASQASSEAALEEMFQKIIRNWMETEFTVAPGRDSKDATILVGVEDIQTLLEESQVTLATIKSSRHIGPIKPEVEKWDANLSLFAATLDAWMEYQRSWLYLESVFQAPDIQRQLPEEAKMFSIVDRNWKDIMRRTTRNPNAMKAATSAGTLEMLRDGISKLDKIQMSLEEYLESKRLVFPRFYFLSNDELLEILSQTKNPQAVQPHLGKCFDAIKSLEFSAEAKSNDILAMISPEGEKVPFIKQMKARGNVETWLGAVEECMLTTLRKLLKIALAEFKQARRSKWILENFGQVVLTGSQILWSASVAKCLSSENPPGELMHFLQISVANLAQLASMVRGDLKRLQRAVLGALITIDVHARDVLSGMISANVSDVLDFEWLKQLRYYWEAETDACTVKMADTSFNYGYEYLGCSSRLVITPLTDRCYLTLTGAVSINLGGSPLGPAGTGKTETVKDLAKALARQCVVFNCSDALDFKMMGKFFAGLAQSGSWCCFDEFNRIDVEVLSVVAQQLLSIKRAKDGFAQRFMFEGKEIRLIPSCSAFITMNPGYAGRQELPDNLKAQFRPIAMMIPDYCLIAEIMLYSEGFEEAKVLAGKVVTLYRLCSEQLSQQDHYDFGMRAVKSVLVMAGQAKRASQNLSEDIVMIRSLRDANLPKFLAEDIPLFFGILRDLFPKVVVPQQQSGQLKAEIETALIKQGYEPILPLVERVIQLYDTLRVRHGVMLVGPPGGGKSVAHRTLARAQTNIANEKTSTDPELTEFQVVETTVINPKCVSIDELYGCVNLATMEWKDGLIGKIIRAQVADTSQTEKWTVFDGPVDPIWVENMNTVLDDNKLLCLTNGERIKLNATIHLLFEVKDLAAASPATVSRCGMVFFDPANLGWRTFVESWLKENIKSGVLDAERVEILRTFFEQTVDSGLAFVHSQKSHLQVIDINLISSLCKLLLTLLQSFPHVKNQNPTAEKTTLVYAYLYSYVWSIGGCLIDSCRDLFDTFARNLFESGPAADVPIPEEETLYSYYVNFQQNTLAKWEELLGEYSVPQGIPFSQIVVPTTDSICYQNLLSLLCEQKLPLLFVGCSGVGKSIIIQDFLKKKTQKNNTLISQLNFSAQTSSTMTQYYLELKAEKRKNNTFGAPAGKTIVFFVDDLNLPRVDPFGTQPPLELLRQFLEYNGVYDREKLHWKSIEDISLVSACAPPGGARAQVSPRLLRHFNVINYTSPGEESLSRIFRRILDDFLKPFSSEVRALANSVVKSAMDLFVQVCAIMLPTPTKSHYTFNLRDLAKVIQGLTQVRPREIITKTDFARVFVHEASRVFQDRLVNSEDREKFSSVLENIVSTNMGEQLEPSKIYFADFLRRGVPREERVYASVANIDLIDHLLEDYLEEYNVNLSKDMRLIFFNDAKKHIARISRVIRMPGGNALLVGVGGTGKKSLTRLACHMAEYQCFEVELTRSYGLQEWRDGIRRLYKMAGLEGICTVFLLSDSIIKDEAFLEDVNSIMNSGDIPNLFEIEDREAIICGLREKAVEAGWPEDRESVYKYFLQRAREMLHIVFATSPVGSGFRNRCRLFPSLINCSTIDWFDEWPQEALLSVSRRAFQFMDFENDELRESVSQMCVKTHHFVSQLSENFFFELRRRVYTTPTSYLELIFQFSSMLLEKRKDLTFARDKLKGGLEKLAQTNELVEAMQVTLRQLGPELKKMATDVEALMIKISKDQETADGVKRVVEEEEKIVKQQAAQTEAFAQDAQRDLDEALPALDAAFKALDSLEKKDVSEMKAFAKPPELVVLVMEAVCILFRVKPDWESSKKLLGDPQFLRKMQEYDKTKLDDGLLRKLKKYTENPQFNPDAVEKVSRAARSVTMWVLALELFSRVSKEVEPKRKRLQEAQATLEETKAKLAEKTGRLKDIEKQLCDLKVQYEESLASKRSLSEKMETTTKRLDRASKLISALADEQVRWTASVEQLNSQLCEIVGSTFVAAAGVTYMGAFTQKYRKQLLDFCISSCVELNVAVDKNVSLVSQLGNPVLIREWMVQGLPMDDHSIESAILIFKGRRWPLIVDPQGQANGWIRKMYEHGELKTLKPTEPNLLRTLELAVQTGQIVLLEDVGETLDPCLEPLLLRQTVRQGGRQLIKLGDTLVEFDANFKLFITTNLANPHYLPELSITVTLVNFSVTREGLEGQLLADVVRLERPELEEQRSTLTMSISRDKKQLKELEERILRLLYNSQGNILDDEELIFALNQSKATSAAIAERIGLAEVTEGQINAARGKYSPAARRGSVLYFVLSDLAEIDQMYQFSLNYFKTIYCDCVKNTPQSTDIAKHVAKMEEKILNSVFQNVSRGLFERHKLVFAFMISSSLLTQKGELPAAEWNFFLRGAAVFEKQIPHKPEVNRLTDSAWQQCCALAQAVPKFKNLTSSLELFSNLWDQFLSSESPFDAPFPLPSDCELTPFEKLLTIRVLCEEKLLPSISSFVECTIGPEYAKSEPVDLKSVYNDMSSRLPLIFILSAGSDPSAAIMKLATTLDCAGRISSISLGQGQGPIAEQCIAQAQRAGEWVFLQNCHLAASWMPRLETIAKSIFSGSANTGTEINPGFRIFLSSMPTKNFPSSVLQDSLKVTSEPPMGLRANVIRSLSDLSKDRFDMVGQHSAAYHKLAYGLCFFNAVIHERKKFGPLGWNISYDWSDADLDVSLLMLRKFLVAAEGTKIPWEAILYMTGDIAFGGRVTDDWDRRTMRTLLRVFYCQEKLAKGQNLSNSGDYPMPNDGSLDDFRKAAEALPFTDNPDIFGMHVNVDAVHKIQEARRIIKIVLDVQPRMQAQADGQSPEKIVSDLVSSIMAELPQPISLACASITSARRNAMSVKGSNPFATDATGLMLNSLSTVFLQEAARYNRLLTRITGTLTNMQAALAGLAVMSSELESTFKSFLNNEVPAAWAAVSYLSVKPLASWIIDLKKRTEMFRQWSENGQPQSFWIPGFFFPQSFLTAVFQNYARAHNVAIDSLTFRYEFLDSREVQEAATAETVVDAASGGVLVHGLYLEGARWDAASKGIADALPMEMVSQMPTIRFIPTTDHVPKPEYYVCPLYKTATRSGTLSTTGHSTNFVCTITLPSLSPPEFWIKRGVALLMQLS